MEKHSYALVCAALGYSAAIIGCTPHDTNSSPNGDTAAATDGDASGSNDAGTSGTTALASGGSATEHSEVGDPAGTIGGAAGSSTLDGEAGVSTPVGAAGSYGVAAGGGAGASNTPAAALGGYTLYAFMDPTNAYAQSELLDMSGNLVNTWNVGGIPVKMLPGGDVIGSSGVFPGDYDSITLHQVSWTGEERWAFHDWEPLGDGTSAARQHHDFEREGNPVGYWAPGQTFVDNGTTVVLAHSTRTVSEVRDDALDDDAIYELDGAGAFKSTLWRAADHIAELGFDDAALADIRTRSPGTTLEWLHSNSLSLVGPNHWYDEGHTEFAPENLILSSRNANFVIIIERETGKVVWRIGPDFAGRPEEKLGQFSGQHNPHLIPKGLPGAGNMLVFDNGFSSGYGGPDNTYRYSRGWSRALEFNPVTFDIVWQYGSESGSDNIYSYFLSNNQRLPNGNTVITLGALGRVIEVTPDKEVVWQYNYLPSADRGAALLYRTYRIPPDWLPAGVNAAHGNYPLWDDLYPSN